MANCLACLVEKMGCRIMHFFDDLMKRLSTILTICLLRLHQFVIRTRYLSSKKIFDEILMTFLMTIILYYSKSYILVIKIIKIIEVQNFSFHQPVKASLLSKFISGS